MKQKLSKVNKLSELLVENKEVVKAITPSVEKLVNQTKKYINYYQTHANHAIVSGKIKKIILQLTDTNAEIIKQEKKSKIRKQK